MKVYKDPLAEFALFAPPKVGSSTSRGFLWEIKTGEKLEGHTDVLRPRTPDSVWTIFSKTGLHVPEWKLPPGILKVAFHRCPKNRLLSYYRGHVASSGETLDDFLSRLYKIFMSSKPDALHVRAHTMPQCSHLGSKLDKYDVVLPLDQIHQLPSILEKKLGRQFPEIPHLNKSEKPMPELSDFAEKFLDAFAAVDNLVGWDGKTVRLPS